MAALPPPHKVGKDAKTRLQEWLQAKQKPLPVYARWSESGEDHAKTFHVTCTLQHPSLVTDGEGGSRRAAEQIAAEAALAGAGAGLKPVTSCLRAVPLSFIPNARSVCPRAAPRRTIPT